MTVPTNTLQTFTQVNIREDLENQIYNVDPYKTPILNMAKKAKAEQSFHEWNVDLLAAQSTSNKQVEGDDATADSLNATGRLGNYCQISRKVVQISGTSQAVRAAGGSNKMGYQLLKASKALKRDMEGTLTANNARAAGSSSVARVSAGLQAWLTQNTQFNSGGSPAGANPSGTTAVGAKNFGNGTTARTYSGTTVAITEATVRALLKQIYVSSGEGPEYFVCSPANKQNLSAFTGPAGTRFNKVEEDGTFKTAIDVYDSDFGPVKVIPDIFLAVSGDIYAVRPEYLKVAYLRPFQTVPLSKTGDSDRKMLIVEYCAEVANESALGACFDTTG